MRDLTYRAPPAAAIGAGATSPNPGAAGARAWSTTTNGTVEWDGAKWNVVAVDDLLAWEAPVPADAWGVSFVYPFSAQFLQPYGTSSGSATTGVLVAPSGAAGYVGTRYAADLSHPAGTYQMAGNMGYWCNLFLSRGLIFEAAAGLSTNAAHCGYIGMVNRGGTGGTGAYGTLGTSDRFFGIGRDEGDAAGNAYLIVCDGTTRSKTLLTRTGAGYGASSGSTFRVQITVSPGANAMLITVIDLSNDYPCLSAQSVSLNSMSQTLGFSATSASATGASATTITHRIYEFGFYSYPGNQVFAQSASNILGNAATSTKLATPRLINGVPFDGTADITLPGGGGSSLAVANVNVPTAQYQQAQVTATVAAATGTSNVVAWLAPNGDWDAEDLGDFEVTAVAGVGTVDFFIHRPGPIVGDFKILYILG